MNHIALHPDSAFDYNDRNYRLGGLAPIIRQKRRLDSTPAPGANLAFYRSLVAMVVAAWETNGLNTARTDLVEHMLLLEGSRNDPREPLAAAGVPDLSTITDRTEPDGSDILMAEVPASATPPQPTPSSWKKFDQKASPGAITFQFSDASFEQTQASEQYSLFGDKADRRRSEPLLQHLLKDRARRFSASPQKFFAGIDRFDGAADAGPSTPVRPRRDSVGTVGSPTAGNNIDFYTPLPAYLKANSKPSRDTNGSPAKRKAVYTDGSPAKRKAVYNIDMRENPDIFGMQPSRDEPDHEAVKVRELANMVEEKCGGNAKVVLTHEDGKLVVRFKLPAKYGHMFPMSQGLDESRFTLTPSAISSTPRLPVNGHQIQDSAAPEQRTVVNGTEDLMSFSEPSQAIEETPIRAHGATSGGSESSSLGDVGELNHTPASQLQSVAPEEVLVDGTEDLISFCEPSQAIEETPIPTHGATSGGSESSSLSDLGELDHTATRQLQREAEEAPSSGLISDIGFEPSFQTPTYGDIDFSPSRVDHSTPTIAKKASAEPPDAQATQAQTPSKATPGAAAPEPTPKNVKEASVETPDAQATQASTPSKAIPRAMVAAAPATSPAFATSFTPVNKPATPKSEEATAPKDVEPVVEATKAAVSETAISRGSGVQYDDSPGRDYMYAFIRRSKPKRLTTTETGSPVANLAQRQPLGDKSPNAGSPIPVKGKRKLDTAVQEQGSPLKAKEEPPSKKRRHTERSQKSGGEGRKTKTEAVASKPAEEAAGSSPAVEAEGADGTEEPRRSTRIRNKPEAQPPKSAIPTPIKLRGGAGRGNQVIKSVRNEQADLTRQTSLNTKKNRGNSESVQQVLARVSEERSGEDTDEGNAEPRPSKRGKNVGWRDPLESFHQTPKAKRSKAAPKTKPTQGGTGVTKSKAASKSRISRAAKNLGMAGNGTPAKRVTRAQTRGQT